MESLDWTGSGSYVAVKGVPGDRRGKWFNWELADIPSHVREYEGDLEVAVHKLIIPRIQYDTEDVGEDIDEEVEEEEEEDEETVVDDDEYRFTCCARRYDFPIYFKITSLKYPGMERIGQIYLDRMAISKQAMCDTAKIIPDSVAWGFQGWLRLDKTFDLQVDEDDNIQFIAEYDWLANTQNTRVGGVVGNNEQSGDIHVDLWCDPNVAHFLHEGNTLPFNLYQRVANQIVDTTGDLLLPLGTPENYTAIAWTMLSAQNTIMGPAGYIYLDRQAATKQEMIANALYEPESFMTGEVSSPDILVYVKDLITLTLDDHDKIVFQFHPDTIHRGEDIEDEGPPYIRLQYDPLVARFTNDGTLPLTDVQEGHALWETAHSIIWLGREFYRIDKDDHWNFVMHIDIYKRETPKRLPFELELDRSMPTKKIMAETAGFSFHLMRVGRDPATFVDTDTFLVRDVDENNRLTLTWNPPDEDAYRDLNVRISTKDANRNIIEMDSVRLNRGETWTEPEGTVIWYGDKPLPERVHRDIVEPVREIDNTQYRETLDRNSLVLCSPLVDYTLVNHADGRVRNLPILFSTSNIKSGVQRTHHATIFEPIRPSYKKVVRNTFNSVSFSVTDIEGRVYDWQNPNQPIIALLHFKPQVPW